ncbi:hypothetical protein GCM10010431_66870 [Streptomyces kunmingensis]
MLLPSRGDEVPVALGPPARGKVVAEAVHRPLLGLRTDSGPYRSRAVHLLVEVEKVGEFREVVASGPEPLKPTGRAGVEGLVGERQALRPGGRGAAPAGRRALTFADGSTAVTSRSAGS